MRVVVSLSPQFDLCYALAELLAPDPRIAPRTFDIGRKLPGWLAAARTFGWSFWLAVPDALGDRPPTSSVDAFIDALADVPPDRLLEQVRRGLFHSADGKPPARKREWLHFVGLDSAEPALPADPDAAAVLDILRAFRGHFEPVWQNHLPELARSADEARGLAESASFPELARRLALPIEGGEPRGRLRALRGGWSIATADVDAVYLIPGAFNPRRFCHAADEGLPAALYFPYQATRNGPLGTAPIDPWLVARAVGDPTRAAIVRRLAAEPRTASALMAELGLSKATISHHIFQLREAGLIDERRTGKSILLSLRQGTLDGLGAAFARELGSV